MTGALSPGAMLNAYPDSLGGRLSGAAALLARPECRGAFSSFYILPSLFHSDLDRGFSVVDYGLEARLASEEDLAALRALGVGLKLDLVMNHASMGSPQFLDLLEKGEASPYRDFFIDWNRFWAGCGEQTAEGYIQPREALLRDMFFRKPGLPLLMVPFPGGRRVPYWNTFYQEERRIPADEAAGAPERTQLLGQMDLNVRSPLVWDFYRDTLRTLRGYGAELVRLDAFAYAHKAPGARNFLNEPGTWELLARLREIADPLGLTLLPEIHAAYGEGVYARLAAEGYPVYDFFLPGLLLDAFEQRSGEALARWASELAETGIRAVNMLGCHDGIPLLDLRGLLPEARIERLIAAVVGRGGRIKELHGQKNVYYQVNAAYFSALGEDERRLLLARAVQLFLPGKPQVWYLDLFAGKNDRAAADRAGAGGHKEINRTNLSAEAVAAGLERPVVRRQLALLRMHERFPVFSWDARVTAGAAGSRLTIRRELGGQRAELTADFADGAFSAAVWAGGQALFRFEQA